MGNNVLHSERMYVNMKIVIKNLEIEISPDEIKYLQIDRQIDKMANEIKGENEKTEKDIKKIEEEIKNTKIGF